MIPSRAHRARRVVGGRVAMAVGWLAASATTGAVPAQAFGPGATFGVRSHSLAVSGPARQASAGGQGGETANPMEESARAAERRLFEIAGAPESIVPLYDLVALAGDLPATRLEGPLRRVVEDPRSHPLVAAHARQLLAGRLEARGDVDGATALRAPLGLLTQFSIVGPFGDGRSAFATSFGPEAEVSAPALEHRFPGKEREVGWREVGWRGAAGAIRKGALVLDALLRPASQAAAYAATWVKVGRATPIAVRVATPGPVKIWCNGVLAHARDAVRTATFDQDAAGVELRVGWNVIVIKTVVTEGPWQILARLTSPTGTAVAFEQRASAPEADGNADPNPDPKANAAPDGRHKANTKANAKADNKPRVVEVRTLEAALRERVRRLDGTPKRASDAALAHRDLGRYLAAIDPSDREQKEARRAYETAVSLEPSFDALMALADASREDDERRRALERAAALEIAPRERARVLAALGNVARDQSRDAVAIERWRRALEADARWWPASLALAEQEQTAGLAAAALARIEALPSEIRQLPRVQRHCARLNTAIGRHRAAEKLWRSVARGDREDLEALRELAEAARVRGAGDEAIGYLEHAAVLRPELPSLIVDWARALEGAGRRRQAELALEHAASRLADDAGLLAEIGRLRDRANDRSGALLALRRALALKPQDQELRRYVDGLAARASGAEDASAAHTVPAGATATAAPTTTADSSASAVADRPRERSGAVLGEDLQRRFASSAAALIAEEGRRDDGGSAKSVQRQIVESRETREGRDHRQDPAVVLLDRRVVRVHENGLSATFAQRVVAVHTDKGAEEYKEFYIAYTPGDEEVEILVARIHRPRDDGRGYDVIEAPEREDENLSEPWYGLYYDHRAEVVRFDGLRARDVIELQYVVANVSRENQLAGYFGDLQFAAETVPKRRWDYTLIGPAARRFHFAHPGLPPPSQGEALAETRRRDAVASVGQDEQVYRFVARDVARMETEPAMPGLAELSPYVHVSTYASWQEVGAWYWGLIEEQLAPDDAIRAAARGAVKAGMSDEQKVRALHALVVTGTRYVGLEFGIHGFRPYRVSQILARRFGDCKDKAALLVAFLREVGIEAEITLLRTRQGGRLASAPASLAAFDHAIVFVPRLGLYIDGTAEFAGMRELPAQDQGVMGLRVGPRGARLIETPVLPSSENRAVRRWDVTLARTGEAEVVEKLTISGQAAPEWRSHYQTEGERRERYAKAWSGRHPGTQLLRVEMAGIEDRARPVNVVARAKVPALATVHDGALALPLAARDTELARTYARLSERSTELVLAYPWQHDEEIAYRLPPGLVAQRLPEPRVIASPFGRFTLTVKRAVGGRTLQVHSTLDVTRHRLSAAEYGAFRRFLGEVDRALAERISLVATTASTRPLARAASP